MLKVKSILYCFCLLLSCCLGVETFAQSTNPVTFSNYQKKDGLPSNTILGVTKDKLGFLWIATNDGLCRYDGPNLVKVYRKSDDYQNSSNSLLSNNIRALHCDSNGTIWIGTRFGGLTSFHPSTNEWKTYRNDPKDESSINNDEVLVIFEDSKKRIWIGTESGLNIFNPETSSFKRFKLFNSNVEDRVKPVLSILEDDKGWIWAGTWSGGLHLLKTKANGDFNFEESTYFQPTSDKNSNNVWSLFQDKKKRYWIGTHGSGLLLMDIPDNASNIEGTEKWMPDFHAALFANRKESNIQSNSIQVIKQDNYDNLWIGTTHGLYRINGDLILDETPVKENLVESYFSSSNDEKTIAGNNVTDILEDEQGLIWVATTAGLCQFNWYSNQIKSYSFPKSRHKLAFASNIFVDNKNHIWTGVSNGGLFKFKLENGKLEKLNVNFLDKILGSTVYTIHSPNSQSLYIGTNKGITFVDLETEKIETYPLTGPDSEFENLEIMSILTDDNNIWAGTKAGLLKINKKTKAFTSYQPTQDINSISDYAINHVIKDSKGFIWIASYKGLNRIKNPLEDDLEFEKFFFNTDNPEKGPMANEVMYLKEIGKYLYVGTLAGICRYNYETNKFEEFHETNQIFWVRSIEEGINNSVWISSNEGIFHYDEKQKSLRAFDKKDGLTNISFQLGSSCKDNDDQIYFASEDGFTILNPEKLKSNTIPPPVYVTEIEKMTPEGIVVEEGIQKDEILLDHDTYRLSINLAVLNYNRFEKNKIEYKLEGFEEQWNKGKIGTPIVYTSLKAKDYKLLTRAANNDGIWNEEGATISIVQTAPYWEKWWFRLLMLALLVTLTLRIFFWYTNKIRKHNEELQSYNKNLNQEIATRKKIEETLNEKNNELKRSNKDLEQFAYVSSHDLKEPLRSIGNFSSLLGRKYNSQLDDNGKEYIQFIEGGVARMFEVIDSLLTYSTVGRKEDAYSKFNLHEVVESKIADLNQLIKDKNAKIELNKLPTMVGHREQIGMVFFNLINNAIKFNIKDQPQVKIQCSFSDKDYWEFSVEDNGIGIDQKYKDKVFDVFNRLHSKKEYEGTGIGLAVCHKIISRHEGKIWFKTNKNGGTTFYFTISKNLTLNHLESLV